jgi:calcyclin binding protein
MVLIEDITDKRDGGQQELQQQQQQQPSATSTTDPSPSADIAAAAPATAPAPAAADDNDEALEEYEDPDVSPPEDDDLLPSDERMLDAHEIEQLVSQLQRPTAKLHVTSLITKLRRESEALQRLEKTHQLQQSPTKPDHRKTATDENKDPVSKRVAPPKAAPPAAVLSPPPQPIPVAPAAAAAPSTALTGGLHAYYVPIDTFAFDAGGYNSPFVTLYVDLPRVGSIPRDAITCHFTKSSVDLIVRNLDSKSYRLYKDNLDKDVDPTQCKIVVKSHKVLVKLAKVKSSEYGSSYDYWTQLTAKKSRKAEKEKKEDPSASIMQLMRDMYEDGDDSMRKVIGETMLKQQRGELGGGKNDPMGGGGGMGMGGFKDDDDDEDF